VKKGEVFGLLGPNGAGKSTMFNLMSMDLKRTSGEIRLLGNEIDKVNIVRDGNKMGMCA
jgi:ABC-type multidrug transport system ATPase subunit